MGGIKQTFLIAVLVVVLGFGFQKFLQWSGKFKDEVSKEQLSVNLAKEMIEGDYHVITVDILKEWMDENKKMVIIDTMPSGHYEKMHIPGAIQFLFPIPFMSEWDSTETDGRTLEDFEAMLGEDKSIPVIIYCGFVKCSRSHNAGYWARKLDFQNVYRLPGGIFAWKGADFETE